MNAHEVKTRGRFKLTLGHLSEGLPVHYEEETREGNKRKVTIETQVLPQKEITERDREQTVMLLFLNSFEEWVTPQAKELTLHEYQAILKRTIYFLEAKGIKVVLE